MKKSLAIALLSLHLFSLYGNAVLYQFMVYRSDRLFNEQISKDRYKLDDLFEVKLPVHMPGIQDWVEYVHISGQVQFKDNSYNYVKLRMTRDTVFLMCVPNYQTTRLHQQNIIDARKIADVPFSKKGHVPLIKTVAIAEYNYQTIQYRFLSSVVTLQNKVHYNNESIIERTLSGPVQPPEAKIS